MELKPMSSPKSIPQELIIQMLRDMEPKKWLSYVFPMMTVNKEWRDYLNSNNLLWFELYSLIIKHHGYDESTVNKPEIENEWEDYVRSRRYDIIKTSKGLYDAQLISHGDERVKRMRLQEEKENKKDITDKESISFWKLIVEFFYVQNYEPIDLRKKPINIINEMNVNNIPFPHKPLNDTLEIQTWQSSTTAAVTPVHEQHGFHRKLVEQKGLYLLWGTSWRAPNKSPKRTLEVQKMNFSTNDGKKSVFQEVQRKEIDLESSSGAADDLDQIVTDWYDFTLNVNDGTEEIDSLLYFYAFRTFDVSGKVETQLKAYEMKTLNIEEEKKRKRIKSDNGFFMTDQITVSENFASKIKKGSTKRFTLGNRLFCWIVSVENHTPWIWYYDAKERKFLPPTNTKELLQKKESSSSYSYAKVRSYDAHPVTKDIVYLIPNEFKNGFLFVNILKANYENGRNGGLKLVKTVKISGYGFTANEIQQTNKATSIYLPWLRKVLIRPLSWGKPKDYILVSTVRDETNIISISSNFQLVYDENQIFLHSEFSHNTPSFFPIVSTIQGNQSAFHNFDRDLGLLGVVDVPLLNGGTHKHSGDTNGFQRHGLNMCFLNNSRNIIYKPYAFWPENAKRRTVSNLKVRSMITQFSEMTASYEKEYLDVPVMPGTSKEGDEWTVLLMAGVMISVHPRSSRYFVRDSLLTGRKPTPEEILERKKRFLTSDKVNTIYKKGNQ